MRHLRWLTAGESHGPGLVGILEGLPADVELNEELIRQDLSRRQQGFGRGGRMKIESDHATLLSGVRHGKTLGSPISLFIANKDHENWRERMKIGPLDPDEDPGPLQQLPRPGHADLAGGIKYQRRDLRDVLERASARETAARVALGAIARQFLAALDIHIGSSVVSIHQAKARPVEALLPEARFNAALISQKADASPVRCADPKAEAEMIAAIRAAQKRRDTVGGVFEVWVSGLPPGIGSHVHWDRRLDGRLMGAFGSIQAIKGVEIGHGFGVAARYGSESHDPIHRSGPALLRASNHAGGTEGGMSNGEPLVIRAAMKPIATLSNALPSVNLSSGAPAKAHVERSDTCAVPAAAVVGEAMAALCIADALLETFGGDTLGDVQRQLRAAWKKARRLPGHVYLIGLSGSGKSTLSSELGAALAMPAVDLDQEIERETGSSVSEIFEREGEAAFRQRELKALRLLAGLDERQVIALGAGAILNPEARDLLRRSGTTVWLDAPTTLLASRLAGSLDRPLLVGDPETALNSQREERQRWYSLLADLRVEASARPEMVAQRVVGGLGVD